MDRSGEREVFSSGGATSVTGKGKGVAMDSDSITLTGTITLVSVELLSISLRMDFFFFIIFPAGGDLPYFFLFFTFICKDEVVVDTTFSDGSEASSSITS